MSRKKSRPAVTPDNRQAQVVAQAVDLAEKQIKKGTVSSQVHTQYLKLADPANLQLARKRVLENQLLEAKIKALESSARTEVLYQEALDAFRSYAMPK